MIKHCKEVGGSVKWNWNRKKGRKGHGVGACSIEVQWEIVENF